MFLVILGYYEVLNTSFNSSCSKYLCTFVQYLNRDTNCIVTENQ